MTLKSVRDPILPITPTKEEWKTYEADYRWKYSLLETFARIFADVYDDLSRLEGLPTYANNAAAIAGGLLVGDFYRTGGDPDTICVVH